MKTLPRLIGALGLCLASLAPAVAQTPLPFDSFESYADGNLHGQGGWTVTNLGGTSHVYVGSNYALSGLKSMYMMDNDSTNSPRAWREPTGSNITHGRFGFGVLESQVTGGRDYWSLSFGNVGTTVANFKLALSAADTITLYGGPGAATALASVNIVSSNGTYDPTIWNTFSIVFNETTNTASVYLNEGTTPILTSNHAATNWVAGRTTVSAGFSNFVNVAALFDESLPEWEITDKLRYAPPTLVAPSIYTPGNGFSTITYPGDEDVVMQLSPTQVRQHVVGVTGGRSLRVIGGDLGRFYMQNIGQTKSLYMEGIKCDMASNLTLKNGVPVETAATVATGSDERDGIVVIGTKTGPSAKVYLQNSHLRGVHGVGGPYGHGPAIGVSSITLNSGSIIGLNYGVTINTSTPMTLYAGVNMVIVGATTEPKLSGTYKITLPADTTSSTFTGQRWDNFNPLPTGLSSATTGLDGYVWYIGPGRHFGISSVVLNSVGPGTTFGVTINTTIPETLPAGVHTVQVKSSSQAKLNTYYDITLASATTSSSFSAVRTPTTAALPAAPFSPGLTGTNGFFNRVVPGYKPLHADAYTSNAGGIYDAAYFYRVTLNSTGTGFIGMNQNDTDGMRSLVMTRVNMSVNNIWPQDYDSQSIYLGTTDQTPVKGWGDGGFPVSLDRVYIKPRANRTITAAVWPGIGATRTRPVNTPPVPVGAITDDGGESCYWAPGSQISGTVVKSNNANGYPHEPGYATRDYASLTGPNAPGLNYVSPGYSAGAVQPLVMTAVTGAPALTTINVPVASTVGTLVSRLDVAFTGDGHIIDLTLTDASGRFGMDTVNKRNVVVKTTLAAGSYPVTIKAVQSDNAANFITKAFTIIVP